MGLYRDVDRRTFLKFGAAGAALAAVQPQHAGRPAASQGDTYMSADISRHGIGPVDLPPPRSIQLSRGNERVWLRASREIRFGDHRHFLSALRLLRRTGNRLEPWFSFDL